MDEFRIRAGKEEAAHIFAEGVVGADAARDAKNAAMLRAKRHEVVDARGVA